MSTCDQLYDSKNFEYYKKETLKCIQAKRNPARGIGALDFLQNAEYLVPIFHQDVLKHVGILIGTKVGKPKKTLNANQLCT